MFLYEYVQMCQSTHVEIRGRPMGIGPLLPPRESWGLNSDRYAWQQALLLAEPSHWSYFQFFFDKPLYCQSNSWWLE